MRRGSALVLIFLATACAAPPQGRTDDPGNYVPLNLDYSRRGLVQPRSPWGWWLQPLEWLDVGTEVVSGELRFARSDPGPPARAIYDLNAPLGGRRIAVEGTARASASSGASLRLGLVALEEDWETVEAWSVAQAGAELAVTLRVPSGARNVQILVEYQGAGEIYLSPLKLRVDGQAVDDVAPGQSPPPESDYAWVARNAIPLDSTEPGTTTADLAPLRGLLGDKRFVLLGESTHGSREMFTLKDRIVRWLLEEEGFSAFVLEDHVSAAAGVDEHVQTGQRDPAEAMEGLFGFWRRQSMLELVEWMRGAVESGSVEASFLGIDMQVPSGPLDALDRFAAEGDASLAEAIEATVGSMRAAWAETRYPRRSPEEHRGWVDGAQALLALVEERAPDYRSRIGVEATARLLFNARLLVQSAEVSAADDIRVRDRFLAENLSAIARRSPPETRFVVWAHNTHVRRDESAMGEHLARLHPGEVVSIGLFTQEGAYVAWDGSAMREYALFPGPVGSIEEILHRSGHPVMALDLRTAAADLEGALSQPLFHRNIGLFPADLGFYRTVLPSGFDALLFIDHTSPTRPIP